MSTIPKEYRKKPVVIEAIQMAEDGSETLEELDALADWCGGEWSWEDLNDGKDLQVVLYIDTLEGTMRGAAGDFIIRGVNGEFYPCKSDIFAKTYEAVE